METIALQLDIIIGSCFMQFPSLCPYNDANYSLVILDERAMIVHDEGPYTRHWLDQESLVTIDMRETELHRNAHYSANIRVWNLAGQASTSFTFSELSCVHVIHLKCYYLSVGE